MTDTSTAAVAGSDRSAPAAPPPVKQKDRSRWDLRERPEVWMVPAVFVLVIAVWEFGVSA